MEIRVAREEPEQFSWASIVISRRGGGVRGSSREQSGRDCRKVQLFSGGGEGRLGKILLRSRPRFLWKFITTFTRNEIKTGVKIIGEEMCLFASGGALYTHTNTHTLSLVLLIPPFLNLRPLYSRLERQANREIRLSMNSINASA